MKKKKEKTLKTVAWFLIKLNLLAIPLWVLVYLNFSLPFFQVFLTDILYGPLKFFGVDVVKNNFLLSFSVNNIIKTIEIDMACTGWKSMYFLFALVLATPIQNNKKKLKFLAFGLPFIFLINFFRVLSTILIVHGFGLQYLDVVHTILWREGLIFAVLLTWFLWLRKEKYNIGGKQGIFRWVFGRA
jgi:exosortase/archaeosortase family protein